MQRYKIFARIVLLILSVINFALAAPVSVRGIREVRVVDVAEDVTTASQKRWNPSDESWTNAALADRANTPQSLGSSDSDSISDPRLEHELKPHETRSPGGSGDNSHPLPVDPPPLVQEGLPSDTKSNASPQPGQGSADGADPSPGPHSTSSQAHSDSDHSPTSSEPPPPPWNEHEAWASSSPSHASSPSPERDPSPELIFYHRPHPLPKPEDQLSPATDSDPGRAWPYSPTDSGLYLSDPGPSIRPYSPSNSEQSTGAYPPPGSPGLESSKRPDPPASDSGQPGAHPPSDSVPSIPHPLPSPGLQEPEKFVSELLKGGKFKRRISGSGSVNAAQKELQGALDSRDSTNKGSDKIILDASTTATP